MSYLAHLDVGFLDELFRRAQDGQAPSVDEQQGVLVRILREQFCRLREEVEFLQNQQSFHSKRMLLLLTIILSRNLSAALIAFCRAVSTLWVSEAVVGTSRR